MTEATMAAEPAIVERIPTAIVLERVRGDKVTRITAWIARVGVCRMTSRGTNELVNYSAHGWTFGSAATALRREVERGEEGWTW